MESVMKFFSLVAEKRLRVVVFFVICGLIVVSYAAVDLARR